MGVNFPLIISVRSAGSTIELCCPALYPLPKRAGEFGCVPGQAMVRPGDRTSLKSPAPYPIPKGAGELREVAPCS